MVTERVEQLESRSGCERAIGSSREEIFKDRVMSSGLATYSPVNVPRADRLKPIIHGSQRM